MDGSHTAVRIESVSKLFRLYHERAQTLKERIVNRRRASFEDFWALHDVSAQIGTSETAGLIGPNGSGKSTLLKVIAGIYRPTSGTVTTRGRLASLLELGAGFHPDLTGRENVYLNASILGLTRRETQRHFQDIVNFAFAGLDESFIDLQVRHYSSGMYTRLGFAVAVHVDPDILIVDEVLAVGDETFQRRCIDKIREFQSEGRTILFVTHGAQLVRDLCTHALFLHKGRLQAEGTPNDVIRIYRQRLLGEEHLEALTDEERGSGEIRIADVRILDAAGIDRRAFQTGEAVDIVVTLESTTPVDDPHLGLAIYDDTGRCIYGTNTIQRGVDLGRVDGKVRVAWRVPSIPVLDGTCHLTLGVHTRDERHAYHWREKAWTFHVVNPGAEAGSVDFNAGIEVERL